MTWGKRVLGDGGTPIFDTSTSTGSLVLDTVSVTPGQTVTRSYPAWGGRVLYWASAGATYFPCVSVSVSYAQGYPTLTVQGLTSAYYQGNGLVYVFTK